ncbi:MAG: hypothetical protein RR715_00225 [Comamonas sp.]
MKTNDFDELAGRIDGVAQALLRIVAELEMARLMDGPRLSAVWRQARPEQLAIDQQLQASRHVLHQMADSLDAARQHRSEHRSPEH